MGARRAGFVFLVLATALVGTAMMADIVGAGGITALEVVILILFALTFSWIGISFWNAIIGFVLHSLRRHPLTLRRAEVVAPPLASTSLNSRTALVMPAYNEDPGRVMGGLTTILRSLARTGLAGAFDVHLLSDTTDPAIARTEERAWGAFLRDTATFLPPGTRLYYRRREQNTGRKAGNIAEFCRRQGHQYNFMVVLDADSLMSGETLVTLARTMEANPRAGLIQTVPLPARQTTLFGRLVQFAGCLYSPMLATGQSFWHADAANYWGHNAIIRVAPFSEHGTLPVLSGRAPWGGEILSHDFVEAALLRRAGWQILLLPELGGSTEEVPGNIPDYARRDRRWAQGSLQHLRLLGVRGLHPLSRLHFLLGAMGYISSLLWLMMLLAATLYVLLPHPGPDPLFMAGARFGAGSWLPAFMPLLMVTGILLLLPKMLALGLVLARRQDREGFGGFFRLLGSALVEMVFAVVVAPLMMMYHARAVLSILAARTVRWDPQDREGRSIDLPRALRDTFWITAVGVTWSVLTFTVSPGFFLWMSPIFLGLVLAAPLVAWTSRREGRGVWFRVPSGVASGDPSRLDLDPALR